MKKRCEVKILDSKCESAIDSIKQYINKTNVRNLWMYYNECMNEHMHGCMNVWTYECYEWINEWM